MFEGFRRGLDPQLNERACMLVMRDIAIYPQSFESRYVTAESVLLQDEPDTPTRLRTGVGMVELAQVRPNGAQLMSTVDRIHDRFGITDADGAPMRVSPARVEGIVKVGAYSTLVTVFEAAQDMSRALGIDRPANLASPFPPNERIHQAKLEPKKAKVFATNLRDFLQAEPEIRAGALSHVSAMASHIRRNSRNQREYVQSQNYLASKRNSGHF